MVAQVPASIWCVARPARSKTALHDRSLYFQYSNGQRAAIILEECGLPYRVHKVDLATGEQKTPEFLNINPAGAIPAIVDHDVPGAGPLRLSQSAANVLYTAEKTGRFLPVDPGGRALARQWLMLVVSDVARASTWLFLCSAILLDKSRPIKRAPADLGPRQKNMRPATA